MISLRTPLIAATVALAGWAGTAQAQANVTYAAPGAAISVQFGAPPPMRYEAVPAPRRGYVWAPGYWRPQGHRHAWVAGHWVKAPAMCTASPCGRSTVAAGATHPAAGTVTATACRTAMTAAPTTPTAIDGRLRPA